MRYLIFLISIIFLSCNTGSESDHVHDEMGSHTHGQDARPTKSFTYWTDHSELFVEFPVLVAGQTSRFTTHVTVLDGHQPLKAGVVAVSLIDGNNGIRHKVDGPSEPGIYFPVLKPAKAGVCKLIFDISTPEFTDRVVIEDVKVYDSRDQVIETEHGDEEHGNTITFLKEQAWRLKFQTSKVRLGEVFQTISTSGIWRASPSEYQTLVAPMDGRVEYGSTIITEGTPVRKGQVVMKVSGSGLTTNNLDAEIQMAEADLTQARSEYDRKKELYESKVIPKAEYEVAEQRYKVSKTRYETLKSGYSSGGKEIGAPMNGFVRTLHVTNGEYVEQGDELITVTSQNKSLLEIQVGTEHIAELNNVHNIWYQARPDQWSNLNENGGRILSVGREVSPEQPLISVFARVNEGVEMPEGAFTEVRVSYGSPQESLVVPASCLLEDYGKYSVIVQLGGEEFEQRNVTVGQRNGEYVQIVDGLNSGEMVVTQGAYQVKMAAMSGQAPAHGHVH